LMITPRLRETANPFTGPVPNWNNTAAVMSVVTWESMMVRNALSSPASSAALGVFPRCSYSRIRSKIRTFASTDIPMRRTMAAIPGKVSVAPRAESAPMRKITFNTMPRFATIPDSL